MCHPILKRRGAEETESRAEGNREILPRLSHVISWIQRDARICERRASGRVGVPPAVLGVPRSTRQMSFGKRIAFGVREYSAGCGIRQAGRPPYPETCRCAQWATISSTASARGGGEIPDFLLLGLDECEALLHLVGEPAPGRVAVVAAGGLGVPALAGSHRVNAELRASRAPARISAERRRGSGSRAPWPR